MIMRSLRMILMRAMRPLYPMLRQTRGAAGRKKSRWNTTPIFPFFWHCAKVMAAFCRTFFSSFYLSGISKFPIEKGGFQAIFPSQQEDRLLADISTSRPLNTLDSTQLQKGTKPTPKSPDAEFTAVITVIIAKLVIPCTFCVLHLGHLVISEIQIARN